MNTKTKASGGQRGDKVRSDCYFEIELTDTGGVILDLKSKVHVMYGESIKNLIVDMCGFFSLTNANIFCEDNGALPSTIMARFELVIKRLGIDNGKQYLPAFNKTNNYGTTKDKLRRSRLYLPGNEPKFYPNAGLHQPDGIILDLEDSVSPSEKDAAQLLVRNSLRSINFYGAERMVRINQLPMGLNDLQYVIPNNVNVVLIPKCESAEQIISASNAVQKIKEELKLKNEIYFMPIIESALGVEKSYEIASASDKICALAVGLEDYTADIGVERTNKGNESFVARSKIVNAAKAAGIQAIDTVFSDVNDMDALRESVYEAKSMGFEGKGCIHPRQIKVVHEALAPTSQEIEKAKKIVAAYEDAKSRGLGVVSIGSKMIDAPVVKRAHRVIKLAILNKQIQENWNEI
ncbi:MAG: HpcH/HpaI aldolase/citrate lyase family protein [Bacteroidetes bacterium]|nr:HpcH/HpaI aldolase/citrate lyase family protein [Bacteroidota bacterium]